MLAVAQDRFQLRKQRRVRFAAIEQGHFMSTRTRRFNQMTSKKTCAANDKDFHFFTLVSFVSVAFASSPSGTMLYAVMVRWSLSCNSTSVRQPQSGPPVGSGKLPRTMNPFSMAEPTQYMMAVLLWKLSTQLASYLSVVVL